MSRPYFLWDRNLNERQIKEILSGGNLTEKLWLTARILESARFSDVFRYLTAKQIRQLLPGLKMKKSIKKAWERAFNSWS